MKSRYHYLTNCTESTAEAITAMCDRAREITYQTALRHIGLDSLLEVFPHYVRYPSQGLTIKKDWHVRYSRSIYQGKRCYIVVHSAIEYIWVQDGPPELRPTKAEYCEQANQKYVNDDINIDANAKISRADTGAWVQGWLWVDDTDVPGYDTDTTDDEEKEGAHVED